MFEETDNRYYQEVDLFEYHRNVAVDKFGCRLLGKEKPIETFGRSEVKRLKDLMENNPNATGFEYNKFVEHPEYGWIDYFKIYLNSIDHRGYFRQHLVSRWYGFSDGFLITKTNDDWFWVQYFEPDKTYGIWYYKCDQFDGLLKLLKDKKVISDETP